MSPLSQTDIFKGLISAQLNSFIFYVLLVGMYTMVFVWTIYIYYSRKEAKNILITSTLVALYINTVIDLGIQWQFIKNAFVDNGETRSTIILTLSTGENVLIVVGTIVQYIGYFLADGLLVWRCFHVTNRSILSTCVPFFFFFCVIATAVVNLAFFSLLDFNPSLLPHISSSSLDLIANGTLVYIVDSAASLSATFIIFRRISKSLSKMSGQRRYKRILQILIEAAALYSFSSILLAIIALINLFIANERAELLTSEAINYLLAFNSVATGLAPTIMVAQISIASGEAFTSTDDATTTSAYHISAIEFHHQQTVNNTLPMDDTENHLFHDGGPEQAYDVEK